MEKQYHLVNQNIVVKSNTSITLLLLKTDKSNKVFKSVKASCGCMTPKFNKGNSSISVGLQISSFPSHFDKSMQEFVASGKTITVNYKDGSSEVHPITYKIKR